MQSARVVVGRLLEVRVDDGYRTQEHVNAVFAAVSVTRARAELDKIVAVTDLRRVQVLSADAATNFVEGLAPLNRFVEQSAILVDASASLFSLQVTRMVREAGHARRKVCQSGAEVMQWLAPALTEAERARLAAFLTEVEPVRPPVPLRRDLLDELSQTRRESMAVRTRR